eukprot:COSAG04_NODE_142_length_23587_cov_115.049295_8_plen_95_part_00
MRLSPAGGGYKKKLEGGGGIGEGGGWKVAEEGGGMPRGVLPVDKTCPKCGKEFTNPAAYASHTKSCGKVRATPSPPDPFLLPTLCSYYCTGTHV